MGLLSLKFPSQLGVPYAAKQLLMEFTLHGRLSAQKALEQANGYRDVCGRLILSWVGHRWHDRAGWAR